jgi:hypothetical protein
LDLEDTHASTVKSVRNDKDLIIKNLENELDEKRIITLEEERAEEIFDLNKRVDKLIADNKSLIKDVSWWKRHKYTEN